METLNITIPDFSQPRKEIDNETPFFAWTVGDQPLIYHWLDYGVDQKAEKVVMFSDETEELKALLKQATLWPIDWEVYPLSEKPPSLDCHSATWLPNLNHSESLSIKTGWDLLRHHFYLERFRMEYLQQNAFSLNPDMAVGRFAMVHPEAELIAPYIIGDEVYIGKGAVIGPYSRIGQGSFISENASISGSTLDEQTYVGPHTRFSDHHITKGKVFQRGEEVFHAFMDPEIVSYIKERSNPV